MEKTIKIPGITCNHCLKTINLELEELGIEVVSSELETKSLTIRWSTSLTWQQIKDLLTEIGYPPEE